MFQKESVAPDYEGARLDGWMRHRWPFLPYASIQKAIRRGWVRLDGHKACADVRLRSGQEVGLNQRWLDDFPAPQIQQAPPQVWQRKFKSWIVLENPAMVVLNKPQGIASQGGSGQIVHIDGLMQHYDSRHQMRLTHRLDKETSGVLVVAKTLRFAQEMTQAFRLKKVHKVYWALVHGHPNPQGQIQASLLRQGDRMIIADAPEALLCHTRYTVQQYLQDPQTGDRLALIHLSPQTGRMHQLRVHMASIGHPIVGDGVYGVPGDRGPMALHCHSLTFPYGGKRQTVKAPAPEAFVRRLEGLELAGEQAEVQESSFPEVCPMDVRPSGRARPRTDPAKTNYSRRTGLKGLGPRRGKSGSVGRPGSVPVGPTGLERGQSRPSRPEVSGLGRSGRPRR